MLIIQTLDWVLLIGIFGGGIYGVIYTDNRFLSMVAAMFALAVFHQFGRWSYSKLASLRHDLKQTQKTNTIKSIDQ